MKTRSLILSLFLLFSFSAAFAAKVDTASVFSKAMNKAVKAVTIVPDAYTETKVYPVVYLLHGHGGNYGNWVNNAPEIKELADTYSMIIVCPDGGIDSWYWNSPVDPSYRYESFVAGELVDWVDAKFKTDKRREGRAITGLSMGGHGALYLALKHQDVFGAAGSMAGGVDIRPFPLNWGMAKRLGSYAEHEANWNSHTVINMLNLLSPGSLELLIDVGRGDFFYEVNEALHQELTYRNIPHTYTVRPGAHNWDYWVNSIRYQLLFMHEFFKAKG